MSQPITLSDTSQSLFSFVSALHSNDIHASLCEIKHGLLLQMSLAYLDPEKFWIKVKVWILDMLLT